MMTEMPLENEVGKYRLLERRRAPVVKGTRPRKRIGNRLRRHHESEPE